MRKHRRYVRWVAKFLRLWKSCPEVGRIMNVPRQTVWRWSPGRDPTIDRKKEKAIPLLGTMSDMDIARKTGLSQSGVCYFRQRLGIDAYIRPPYIPLRERELREQRIAETQVAQKLMKAWRSP